MHQGGGLSCALQAQDALPKLSVPMKTWVGHLSALRKSLGQRLVPDSIYSACMYVSRILSILFLLLVSQGTSAVDMSTDELLGAFLWTLRANPGCIA